ncbi:hypothetical protein NQ314_007610 [Rhamnusium bicolor]|uniref:PiggyBac transposable element-derived protein domain-containing protein n=1 Tax=Rhamnusium bicolor TaxID=1586634 RepID=A0AAV8YL40_9CUCU|nr:hypothetical protein NQ314_007610 [Rhamnusium bicolor]
MNKHQALSDKELEDEIENFILNGFDSEDDLDIDGVNDSICDPNYIPHVEEISESVDDTLIPDYDLLEIQKRIQLLKTMFLRKMMILEKVLVMQMMFLRIPKKRKYKIAWKKKNLQLNDTQLSFIASDVLPSDILELSTRPPTVFLIFTIPLVAYLAQQGIFSLGTVRRNHIVDCKLPTEKELKKEERGYCTEYVGIYEGVDISTSVWKDNKLVNFVSSFAENNPCSTVKRFNRSKKERIDIPCLYVAKEYNRHMAIIRSKKWYFRIFYHILDMTVANSWLLYRRTNEERKKAYETTKEDKILTFSEFRAEIFLCLCQEGQSIYKK